MKFILRIFAYIHKPKTEEKYMWTIFRIDEADFGCEERLPGEPLMDLITLESDMGETLQFEVSDEWLIMQGLEEGDEWPEEVEEENSDSEKAKAQAAWLDNYYNALRELDEM